MKVKSLKRSLSPTLLALFAALTLLASLPGTAQACTNEMPAGVDFWHTPSTGTIADIVQADFFCPGSAPVAINLKGKTIASSPSIGQSDTIVERLDDACFDNGNTVSGIDIQVGAICLQGTSSISVTCSDGTNSANGNWTVRAALRAANSNEDPVTQISVTRNSAGTGGTFSGSLNVPVRVTFTKGSSTLTLDHIVEFSSVSGSWATSPGSGGVVVGSFTPDTDCDGSLSGEPSFPGNNPGSGAIGFHPGWNPATNPPVSVPVQHVGLDESHLTEPIPPPPTCHPHLIRYLADATSAQAFQVSSTALSQQYSASYQESMNAESSLGGELGNEQQASYDIVAVSSSATINNLSIDAYLPCRYVDAAAVVVVGIAR